MDCNAAEAGAGWTSRGPMPRAWGFSQFPAQDTRLGGVSPGAGTCSAGPTSRSPQPPDRCTPSHDCGVIEGVVPKGACPSFRSGASSTPAWPTPTRSPTPFRTSHSEDCSLPRGSSLRAGVHRACLRQRQPLQIHTFKHCVLRPLGRQWASMRPISRRPICAARGLGHKGPPSPTGGHWGPLGATPEAGCLERGIDWLRRVSLTSGRGRVLESRDDATSRSHCGSLSQHAAASLQSTDQGNNPLPTPANRRLTHVPPVPCQPRRTRGEDSDRLSLRRKKGSACAGRDAGGRARARRVLADASFCTGGANCITR